MGSRPLSEVPVPNVVGVVLAGGGSRRLGRDKALLQLAGESLVARAARKLAQVVTEVVVADAGRGYLPSHPAVADGPGQGPAAGLLGAAAAWPGRPLLALACDLPHLPIDLLTHLAAVGGCDLVLGASPHGLEPLAALYGPAALAALGERVARGRYALHELAEVPGLTVRVLGEDVLRRFGDPAALYSNVNREEDWEAAERLYSPGG